MKKASRVLEPLEVENAELRSQVAYLQKYYDAYFDLDWEYSQALEAIAGGVQAIRDMSIILEAENDGAEAWSADLARLVMAQHAQKAYHRRKVAELYGQGPVDDVIR